MQDAHDLGLVLASNVPLLVFETYDEPRALELLIKVAREDRSDVFQWTATEGLRRVGIGLQLEKEHEHVEPEAVLRHIKTQGEPGIYVLCDFHHWLGHEHPQNIRLLKDIALHNSQRELTVVLLSHRLRLPPELSRLSSRFEASLPDDDHIRGLVRVEARRWADQNKNQKVKTDNDTLQKLVSNLRGLTHREVTRLARGVIADDGAINESDLPEINRAKFQLMDMAGVLSYEYRTERFANVGGMENLKAWLDTRRKVFTGEVNAGNDTPKGILLLGIQGGGKSLAAKAVAGMWGVPLLRLDMGALYNKFYGETERNLRESLKLADAMSPCVLWLDEIEKGLSSDNNDSGVSQRVLGTLLTWMAERASKVFLVATSNDTSRLPPELVRKGRFDELFFVDLPDAKARELIFSIHLKNRNMEPKHFVLAELAAASEGFSGAEIEQVVVSAYYSALAREAQVDDATLLEEIYQANPLSVVMAEQIQALRHWAKERQVSIA